MFTEEGSHDRLLCQQGADLQDYVSMSLCPFLLPCSTTTGACSQHIVSNISYKCVDIQIDLLYNILYNLYRKNVI